MDKILSGDKTIESRLSRSARPPYLRVSKGDRIYFKRSAGCFAASAIAKRVWFFDQLDPHEVDRLRHRFGPAVGGDNTYWENKHHSRFATFIELMNVRPTDDGPAIPPSRGGAWFIVEQPRSKGALRFKLTDGAIRNAYVRVTDSMWPRDLDRTHLPEIRLTLPDGRQVDTLVKDNMMIRWRGWAPYYRHHGLAAGDTVQLYRCPDGSFDVRFIKEASTSVTK